MNRTPPRRLAQFLEPQLDDARIDRAWAAVDARQVRSWRFAMVPAVLVAVAISFVVAWRHAPRAALDGWVVESGTLALPDGTRATLQAGSRLRCDRIHVDRIETTVLEGKVAFEVKHDEARSFVVHAGGVTLVDRGTRFSVEVEGDAVSVSVEEGRVEMTKAGSAAIVLAKGDAWASKPPAVARSPEESGSAAAPSESSAVAPSVPADSNAASPAPSVPEAATARTTTAEPRRATAQELLQTANDARLAGHSKEAATAFDTLRRRYRNDSRAGLAAFELGRLRLDALGDPAGAADALADAVELSPGAPFREDADARLVEAFDQMHDARRCTAARQAYLTRYPNGLHVAAVAAHCH